ncbi:hypothetical protein D3C76_644870 [compost metagenome]
MSKGGGGKTSGGSSKGSSGSGRGPSSHPGPGGNWPSTTGKVSGENRGNAPHGKKG